MVVVGFASADSVGDDGAVEADDDEPAPAVLQSGS